MWQNNDEYYNDETVTSLKKILRVLYLRKDVWY